MSVLNFEGGVTRNRPQGRVCSRSCPSRSLSLSFYSEECSSPFGLERSAPLTIKPFGVSAITRVLSAPNEIYRTKVVTPTPWRPLSPHSVGLASMGIWGRLPMSGYHFGDKFSNLQLLFSPFSISLALGRKQESPERKTSRSNLVALSPLGEWRLEPMICECECEYPNLSDNQPP